MKGLFLKDIYGCRFQIVGGFAIMLLPMLMIALSGGGMAISDEEGASQFAGSICVILYGMLNYMSIVICSSFYLNTLSYDEASGWTKIQRAMPLTGGQIIGGKFLGVGAVVGALTVISVAFNAVSALIFNMPAESMITMPLCIGLAEIVTMLPTIVLGYRLGSKAVLWVYFAFLIPIAAGMVALAAAFFTGNISANALRVIAYAGLPVLAAVVAVLCFVTGKRAVMLDI